MKRGIMRPHIAWLSAVPVVILVVLVGVIVVSRGHAATSGITARDLFAADSPFNTPIGQDVRLSPDSAGVVNQIVSGAHPGMANLYNYGAPIYEAATSDPAYIVNVTETSWGPNPFAAFNPIPIPDNAAPSPGSDAWLIVVDRTKGYMYEIWQAKKVGGRWTGSFGTVMKLGTKENQLAAGIGNGSGMSFMAGVVTQAEMKAGMINHALSFSTDLGDPTAFKYPANKTDAYHWPNPYSPKLPQGARLQLDPSVNCDTIVGITAGEKTVCRALQTYGAYNVDHGDHHLGFVFESEDTADPARNPPLTPGNPTRAGGVYAGVGFAYDYFAMDHIPWAKLRVLDAWNSFSGTTVTPGASATPAVSPVATRTSTPAATMGPTPTATPVKSVNPTPMPTVAPTPAPVVTGDTNGDGRVNVLDLSYLLARWSTGDAKADLNLDGHVGILDLSRLLAAWTG